MNKRLFMAGLNKSLKGLSDDEKQDIIQDFEEHFAVGSSEGQTEQAIAKNLGDPRKIGKEMRATHQLDKVDTEKTAANIFRAVWSVIGISFFNLVIVLGPVIALGSVVFAGWVVAIMLTLTPLMVLVNVIFFPEVFMWFDVFSSLLLSGVSILAGIGLFYLTRLFIKGIVWYLHFNVRMVKGGLQHA